MPSRAAMRTGLISTSALALALLAGSPALADNLVPQIGDACTDTTTLPAELVCVNGLVAAAPAAVDSPAPDPTASAPTASAPATDPAPSAPPADPAPAGPSPVDIPPVAVPPVLGGGNVPPVVNPGTAGGTSTPVDPTASGQPSASGSTNPTKPGTSLQASASTLDPASTTKSLLTAATVSNLASGDLPTLAAMRAMPLTPGNAGQPLSAYTPSPDLADMPAARALSAVQAPLLAVGNDAANGGGFTLAGLSSRALPGLLVVLATALVATVSAGNLRYWQERFGTRR